MSSPVSVLPPLRAQTTDPMALPLSRNLLELHRAMSVPELWAGLKRLLVSVLPCHSVSLYLNYLAPGEHFQVLHHQEAPGAPLPWQERRELSPARKWLGRHVGCRLFGTRDLVSSQPRLERSGYGRRVMAVEGWRSHLCMVHWVKDDPQVMIVVRKTGDQGEFSAEERALFGSLYDHFAVALERIRRMHEEQAARSAFMHGLSAAPDGVLVLDDALRPVFKNRAALDACLAWNLGAGAARNHGAGKNFSVPASVRAACAAWRAAPDGGAGDEVLLSRPDGRGGARIRRMLPGRLGLGRGCFVIQFLDTEASHPGAALDPGLRRLLTPREAEVALAVAGGASNAEVARRLGKSEITVKTQLTSVFAKLGLRRRSQLAALLR